MSSSGLRFAVVCIVAGVLLSAPLAWAQRGANAPATTAAQAPPPKDPLGRATPRGTVLGFMNAVRDQRQDVVPLYLNTNLRGNAALDLAQKLFAVLDTRLPPRVNELSDRPEGSLPNPLKPYQD